MICNLAKSDREDRLSGSLDLLLAHTGDEKFITSRQCLRSIWKVAAARPGLDRIPPKHPIPRRARKRSDRLSSVCSPKSGRLAILPRLLN